jgi:glycosyltransferase involved in cell wall biosynthesis
MKHASGVGTLPSAPSPAHPAGESSVPRVSVVMTVWNGEKYLAETLDSLVAQTLRDFELVVIDDGSTDSTCAIIESYADPRFRLVRQPHAGVFVQANLGVSLARSSYVARLDADDIALPERLQRQADMLDAHPEAVMCYTNYRIFGENMYGDAAPGHKPAYFFRDTALGALQMCFRSPFIHSTLMFRRAAFDAIGGYPDLHPCEDFGFVTSLVKQGPFVGVPEVLVRYRRHAGSATVRLGGRKNGADLWRLICTTHAMDFLKVDERGANLIFDTVSRPAGQRDWGAWFYFCAAALKHAACWRPEPLGWLLSQTYRNAREKLRQRGTPAAA